jgi:hypothetical protein
MFIILVLINVHQINVRFFSMWNTGEDALIFIAFFVVSII